MTIQSVVTIEVPEIFATFSEFLPKFETIVQETLARKSAGTCNLAKIVGNPNDTETFMTMVDSAAMIDRKVVSLEDYPFEVVTINDYPIDVLGVICSINKYWENVMNEELEEGEEVDTFLMALESMHELLNEVSEFVDTLPEIRNEFFTQDADLTFVANGDGKIEISLAS